ncbi:pantoate--beta-alanine ligase, partial [Psychromonas aquatilis]
MQIIEDPKQLRNEIKKHKSQRHEIGIVPTMGNLHQGHLTLVKQAQEYANIRVVS